jgi:hypothetical protein
MGRVKRHLLWEVRNDVVLLEALGLLPFHPSARNRFKVKTMKVWKQGRQNFDFLDLYRLHNFRKVISAAFTPVVLNFDAFKSRGLHAKHKEFLLMLSRKDLYLNIVRKYSLCRKEIRYKNFWEEINCLLSFNTIRTA